MGKRSTFKRNERDYYPTPGSAIDPLLPFLRSLPMFKSFIEPCAGDGRLAKYIEQNTLITCKLKIDIEPMSGDVLLGNALTYEFPHTDLFITNPPWDRDILHQLIIRLAQQAPTWLLLDADWMHTKQSIPYMSWCETIVSVGRVKWIEDSKSTGKDNCCWYLFKKPPINYTLFFGRTESTKHKVK
jgi:hypothetical protein